jgi:hypothetical protein
LFSFVFTIKIDWTMILHFAFCILHFLRNNRLRSIPDPSKTLIQKPHQFLTPDQKFKFKFKFKLELEPVTITTKGPAFHPACPEIAA